jgi:hypothetical protein
MSDTIIFPAPKEDETGAAYWERVRQLGFPFPREADKTLPPSEVRVIEEWANRDSSNGHYWPYDEATVRRTAANVSSCTVVRRIRWESVGPWEEVKEGD